MIEPPLSVEALNVQLTGQAAESELYSEPEPESELVAATDTITITTAMTAAAAETETPPPPPPPPPPPTSQPADATTEPPHVPMPADQSGAAAAEEEEEDEPGAQGEAVLGEEVVADETDKAPSMIVVYAFQGDQSQSQLTVVVGETVELLNTHIAEGWRWARSSSGTEGFVPEGYLKSA